MDIDVIFRLRVCQFYVMWVKMKPLLYDVTIYTFTSIFYYSVDVLFQAHVFLVKYNPNGKVDIAPW